MVAANSKPSDRPGPQAGALRPATRLVCGVMRRFREQVAKDEHARLMAELARLDDPAGAPAPMRPRLVAAHRGHGRQGDPLEELWKLRAYRPGH
jgi:hypothetical protein